MLKNLFYICCGGFIGAVCRYLISGWVQSFRNSFFPLGTLGVNLIGCFIIGLLGGLVENRELLTPGALLFLLVGILGSFTTFSTFGYETLGMIRDQQIAYVLINILSHVGLGLMAAWFGYSIVL